ncbi:hypothetical protein [Halobacterium wangiae]|uniref:hypothetical protein n=1 Tax=Halobacterium wangiae TaxID=2902623 RepID=UPI001E4270B0|nr:hypothetical protein [Halobacterium wangiae]
MSEQGQERRSVEITRMPLRTGGWIGYSEDAVYVDRGGEERVKIANEAIQKIDRRLLEWDIAVMSLLLVGVGGYVVATRNPLVGVAFAAVGVYSFYRTYRKRKKLVVHVENKRKPVVVHPERSRECQEALADNIGLE